MAPPPGQDTVALLLEMNKEMMEMNKEMKAQIDAMAKQMSERSTSPRSPRFFPRK